MRCQHSLSFTIPLSLRQDDRWRQRWWHEKLWDKDFLLNMLFVCLIGAPFCSISITLEVSTKCSGTLVGLLEME